MRVAELDKDLAQGAQDALAAADIVSTVASLKADLAQMRTERQALKRELTRLRKSTS